MSDDCSKPFPERTAGEVFDCTMQIGRNVYENILIAYNHVWTAPGSATTLDWAIAIFLPILFVGSIAKVVEVWRGY